MDKASYQVLIVALRNEKGSYSKHCFSEILKFIVALRNEKGSYSKAAISPALVYIVALRNEKGSYSLWFRLLPIPANCSTAK